LIENSADTQNPLEQELLLELKDLTAKIKVAVAMHVEAVTRTQMVRKKLFIRLFRLAGSAPEPVTYEFEGDVF
jgi:hypothetical protein